MTKLLEADPNFSDDITTVNGYVDNAPDSLPLRLRPNLMMFENNCSLRYNLATGSIQPFVKAGYGYSWYRLDDTRTDGESLENNRSEWLHTPHFDSVTDILLIPCIKSSNFVPAAQQ